jgi:hypothetical protein
MKTFQAALVLPVVLAIAGCGPSVPDCADPATIALVKQMVGKESGMTPEVQKATGMTAEFVVDAIRTTGRDKQTGAYQCAADLKMTISSRSPAQKMDRQIAITYQSALTDGKRHSVQVQVLKSPRVAP